MKQENQRAPSWLKRIQEGSWEPEILISGIVLFGLFKIYPLINELNYFLEMNSSIYFSRGNVNDSLTAILKYANIILIVGFLCHILFRSVWAAFVGLSYVYREGIKYERLNYPKKYISQIEKSGDYKSQIILLEKICSVIFAISFLVFMWLVGFSFFLSLLVAFAVLLQEIFPGNHGLSVLSNIFLLLFIIVFLDFITLGGLRKIPYFNKIYYPLYKISGWVTLSFLYRNIYYGLASNHKKWKISLALILFSLLSVLSVIAINSSGYTPGRTIALATYEDQNRLDERKYRDKVTNGLYSNAMHIQDYVADKSYLELFIVHTTEHEEDDIMPGCDYENSKQKEGISYDSLKMACLEKFYGVALDGELLEDDYIYQRNSVTRQDGLLRIVDISNLKTGKHQIELFYDYYIEEKDSIAHENVSQLTFYKASKVEN